MPTPEKQNRLGRISNRPLGGVLWYAGNAETSDWFGASSDATPLRGR